MADADSQSAIVRPPTDMRPLACLSFDVEEFDITGERGQPLALEEQFNVSRIGLERVLAVLAKHSAAATFFTTATFAQRFPELMRSIARTQHEVASHGLNHGDLLPGHLEESKQILEDICQTNVTGFRRARMAPTDPNAIANAGYTYNASENPIYLPGRYNHFFHPRRPSIVRTTGGKDLIQIPASATPLIRFPLFWLSFKNFPEFVYRGATAWTLNADHAMNAYFHPWEFAEIQHYPLPRHAKAIDGQPLTDRLDRFLTWLAPRARFATYHEYASTLKRPG